MQTATIEDLRKGVAEYMGTASMPLGNQTAYDLSIKAGIDYCWRYMPWTFAIKRDVSLVAVTDAGTTKYYMPTDFDILGWRDFVTEEFDTRDGANNTVNGVYLLFNPDRTQFEVVGGTADMKVAYQTKPPETNQVISFPSLHPLFMAAGIYQKLKDMPNSANVTQLWDLVHQQLDQLSFAAYNVTPKHKPRNRYEQYGTFVGDTK